MNPTEYLDQLLSDPPDTDECVEWPFALGGRNPHAVYNGESVTRILLGLTKGDGLVARHRCHNGVCVNPRHLLSGTPADNSRDMVEAGRSLAGTRNPCWGTRIVAGHRPRPVDF
jgi:hypothetical protein